MTHADQGYGLWSLVILNSGLFIFFGFSLFRPRSVRDWRSFGAFSAFLVALFSEMYGFPLTIYLMLPWLRTNFPGINWLTHDSGHVLEEMFGWRGNPHFGPFHILSDVFIGGGFWLLAVSWPPLYQAQKEGRLAASGPYAKIRHPQYVAFVLVMFGFLLQWPTLLTLAMFPILLFMYWRLGKAEERASIAAFGEDYLEYMRTMPAYIPRLRPRDVGPNASNPVDRP